MSNYGIFRETFRPTKLSSIVLPKRVKDLFADGSVNQDYLFYSGVPGSGKTTLCKALASNYESIYINVSDESSVETIRGKIKNFATNSSIFEGSYSKKIIILDEVDGGSDQFFKALRGVMEQFGESVRFLATCNYINNIPEALQSRFTCIRFEPKDKDEENEIFKGIAGRLNGIINKIGMTIEKDVLKAFVKRSFPDMRKMLNVLQTLFDKGIVDITYSDIVEASYTYTEIFDLVIDKKASSIDNYKYLMANYQGKTDDLISSLGSEFPVWIQEKHPNDIGRIAEILDIVNDASYKRKFVIDPMVNIITTVFKLQKIFRS